MVTSALTVADYIPDPVGRQLRSDLTAPHLTHAEGSWMGYPAEPGYTVVTVANATALMSAIGAAGRESRIIECDWDGVSETSSGANGVNAANLTANAAVDWGHDRSATNILVRPKAGRNPRIRCTAGQTAAGALDGRLWLSGLSRIEFRNLTFDGCNVTLGRNSTFPELTMAVFKRCAFLNAKHKNVGALYGSGIRLLHVEDCLFDGCAVGILHSAHFMRSWNNGFVRHYNQDIHASRSYCLTYQKDWYANVWISGAVVWSMAAQASAHVDFSQISTTQVEVHKGYKQLVEFCVVYADNGTNTSTQGVFGSDGAAQGYRCDHLVHNNILAIGAYWAVAAYDPSDDGTKVATRNLTARVGRGFGHNDGGGAQQDAFPRIVGGRGGQAPGTGRMIVSENYFTHEVDDCGRAKDDDNRWGNINIEPRKSAATALRPETLLSGNGTWGKNASGFTTYTDPASAFMGKEAAKAALLAFFKPKAGWRGAGAGPVDPACWPTNPATIGTSALLTASPPDRVLTSQWSVVDAAKGGAATVTVSALDAGITGLAIVVDGGTPIALATPLIRAHTVSGLTDFSHAFALVATNPNGSSNASVAKSINVTDGNGIFDFDGIKPSLAGTATCTAITGGWQWATTNTGVRTLYWDVNNLMIPGRAYKLVLDIETNSRADAISARAASNTGLSIIRGLNLTVTPSATGARQTFTLTVKAGTDTDCIGLYVATTSARTIKLTNLKLTPV